MEIFGETIDRELHDLAKEGVRTQFVGRRDRAPDWLQAKMRDLEDATAERDAAHALDRLRLRRPRRDRRGGAPARRERGGGRRGVVRARALRARDAGSRSRDPDVGRAARLELPPLAVRVRRVRLHRTRSGPTSARTNFGPRSRTTRVAAVDSAADERNRLPRPGRARRPARRARCGLGGGWWLFALVTVAAADRGARVRDDGAAAAAARAGGVRRHRARARSAPRRAASSGCSAASSRASSSRSR